VQLRTRGPHVNELGRCLTTNSSSVSANNSADQVERMQASECVGALEQRDAITMAPVRSYVKVSGGVMCERTHTVGSLTTAIVGSLATTARPSFMAIPGMGRSFCGSSVQKRSVEGAVTAGEPDRAVAHGPAHARRYLARTPDDTRPHTCRYSPLRPPIPHPHAGRARLPISDMPGAAHQPARACPRLSAPH
jgi:hypothetical protein